MADQPDTLATVRAALDLAAKATPGPWGAEDGSTKWGDDYDLWSMIRDSAGSVICDMFESGRRAHRQISADAVAIVALRNAAPAIADLCREVERLRRITDPVQFDAMIAGYKAAGAAMAARIATLEAALTEACNVLASAWSLIAAEGIAEDDERDELRRINRLRSLIKE